MSNQPNSVHLHRIFKAPPERVYRAFLDPEAMAKWLPPYGFTANAGVPVATGGVSRSGNTRPINRRKGVTMKTLSSSIGLFLSILLTTGCSDSFKAQFKNSFNDSFRKSFKPSFVKSCSADKKEIEEMCACIADDLLDNLEIMDLMDGDKVSEHAKAVSIPKCTNIDETDATTDDA